VALDGTYYTGGRSSIDGVENDDELGNTRVGLTVTLPVNRHNSVKVYASSGVTARAGGDYDAVGLAWQYRWGGGL
jgi:transposase-like protein